MSVNLDKVFKFTALGDDEDTVYTRYPSKDGKKGIITWEEDGDLVSLPDSYSRFDVQDNLDRNFWTIVEDK